MVDALRGFAVSTILLVHNMEHSIYPVYPGPATLPGRSNILNEGVFTTVFALLAGKSYSIPALLSGFVFYTQYPNQQTKGKGFGHRPFWRLLLLTIFVALNTAFYPASDVLLLYVIVGAVLFIVCK